MISLILGGNRSGKTDAALDLVQRENGSVFLVVTGRAGDLEFNEQIREHKASRNPVIPVIETGAGLGDCLRSLKDAADAVLVDSIDFWVFNVLTEQSPQGFIDDFFSALELWKDKRLILVSAEIGLGPLPCIDSVRRFSRLLGKVNQRLAVLSEDVTLIMAGLPVRIK